jgi:hypothetical protein
VAIEVIQPDRAFTGHGAVCKDRQTLPVPLADDRDPSLMTFNLSALLVGRIGPRVLMPLAEGSMRRVAGFPPDRRGLGLGVIAIHGLEQRQNTPALASQASQCLVDSCLPAGRPSRPASAVVLRRAAIQSLDQIDGRPPALTALHREAASRRRRVRRDER